MAHLLTNPYLIMSFEKLIEKLESIEGLLKDQLLDKKKVLNFKEVLYLLGISKNTLYEMVRKNKIPAYRPPGGKLFFIKKELQYWIMSRRDMRLVTVEKLNEDSEVSSTQE